MSVSGNARAEQRRSAYFNPPLYTLAGDNYNGEGGNSESTYVNLTGDAYLTYNKTIGDHTFSAMQMCIRDSCGSARRQGFPSGVSRRSVRQPGASR